MPGDLHNHTTYSDGSVPVARLPLMAARVGLDAMAISDHDTLRSVQYAYDHPVQDGVKLIPATELTGYDYERQHRVHLLAAVPKAQQRRLGVLVGLQVLVVEEVEQAEEDPQGDHHHRA